MCVEPLHLLSLNGILQSDYELVKIILFKFGNLSVGYHMAWITL